MHLYLVIAKTGDNVGLHISRIPLTLLLSVCLKSQIKK